MPLRLRSAWSHYRRFGLDRRRSLIDSRICREADTESAFSWALVHDKFSMRRASFVRGHNKTACPGMDRLAVEPSDDAAGGLAQRDSRRELHAVA